MSKYDTIEVVEKNVDEITEVEKFNPFHDARGRFSSSNGFKSYSANPNTKAGAMAISRSAAAGHGNTLNVHRESYGELIAQNANWLGRGKQAQPRQQGYTTLRTRVEPVAGLGGASATGASWQHQNAQQGVQTKPGRFMNQKHPQQAQQKPAAPKPTKPQAQPQKPAQQQQQAPKKPASDRQPVTGKDISATFKYDPSKKGSPLDQAAEAQGYSGKPRLIKDRAEFSAAVKDSGVIGYRTVYSGTDVVTGKHKTGAQFADDIKNSDNFSHNGNGMRVYGSGMYVAIASNATPGRAPSRKNTDDAKRDSKMYGRGAGDATITMTVDKSAKLGDFNKVSSEFSSLPRSKRQQYGNDLGAYATSKGYDGLKATGAGWDCDYVTMYNRTKLICFDG